MERSMSKADAIDRVGKLLWLDATNRERGDEDNAPAWKAEGDPYKKQARAIVEMLINRDYIKIE